MGAQDSFFEAQGGQTPIGFFTRSTSLDFGVAVAGNLVGVKGECSGAIGDGVQGFGRGSFSGVAGFGGVAGPIGDDGNGVFGIGGGISGSGVRGIGAGAPNTAPPKSVGSVGVYGQGGHGAPGVVGVSSPGSSSIGVHGVAENFDDWAVVGDAHNGSFSIGVLGRGTGFGGYFVGNVHVDGNLVVSGAKSAVVPFPDRSNRLLYCTESPESWFEDFGAGKLVDGHAEVHLEPEFASIIDTHDYNVFLTEYDDNNSLYVTKRTNKGFEVIAKASKAASSSFSYRVVAKRKDIKAPRFDKVSDGAEKLRAAVSAVEGKPYATAVNA